jgi:two-component system NtrC family sensor kinase
MLKEAGIEGALFGSVRRNDSRFLFCACREQGKQPFTEADLEMFVILARQAAVAMENARLYSDLKEYVRQVEESQRRLVQAEKLAAIGRLMASMAHEINNPLQSVRNCLHLASHAGISESQRGHYLSLTDSELERLVSTVRRMLDFYRPGGIEKKLADIQSLFDHVNEMLASQFAQRGVRVIIQQSGAARQVNIVADQIQQVIFNLMLNALDALDELDADQGEKIIWIDVLYEEEDLHIFIEDSGPGIPKEFRERIFEPFVSTKQQGTGLGLSVSYDIMEKHQGRLTIAAPRHGTGACFEITLPIGV